MHMLAALNRCSILTASAGLILLLTVQAFAQTTAPTPTDAPDASKTWQRSDPSGIDVNGSLYKANAHLGGWSAGGTTGDPKINDGSDWQPYGYERDKDGNLIKDKDGKPIPAKPTAESLAPVVAHSVISLNFAWALICGFLVMFMQAGFALFETGLCRAKNAAHTMSMNFLVYALGITGFFICGYAFMCGGAATLGGRGGLGGIPAQSHWLIEANGWGILGGQGFFLSGNSYNASSAVLFLFMMVFMDTAATIPTGALAERWSFKSFFIFSFLIGSVIYPIYGCWVWGGGWLAQLGMKAGLAHGVVDYAGAGVVHMQGGTLALVCAWLLGPRIGKYDANGRPRPIFGHHVPMVMLGTLILAFGWFGFNAGSSLAASDGRIGIIAVNTMLASAAGALSSCLYMWVVFGKPDPSMMCNGMLAGLVSMTAPCAFITPPAAFFIGLVAGVLVIWGIFFFEKLRIDDPVGAVSVHCLNGAWGLIALGLFADGTYGAGINGVGYNNYMNIAGQGVTGLFYGDSKQLIAQLIDVGVSFTWNFCIGGAIFFILGKVLGSNRVPAEVEIAGLDIPEMGAPGYPEFIDHMSPEQVPTSQINAAKTELAL